MIFKAIKGLETMDNVKISLRQLKKARGHKCKSKKIMCIIEEIHPTE